MSYQDPNQPQYGAPPPQQPPVQSGGWGQQSQQQGGWGPPGGVPQQYSGQQQQAWGAPPQQSQIPQQPGYGAAPGYGRPGQSGPQGQFGQSGSQDYSPLPFNNQPPPGYGQGYPGASQSQGYLPQTDFGSGAGYGPGYPAPSQGDSGLATAALWLGIIGGWGLINLVVSILAIRETGPGKKPGRNKAVTGLVLTVAWAIVWAGLFLAVSDHAKNQLAPVASPTVTASTAAGSGATTSATGAAGAQATGASGDAGCQAAQNAFNTYSENAANGGLGAIQTLGNALVAAAGQSKTASSQLKTMGQDYLELANDTTPTNMVGDLEALDSACGMSFTFG